MSRDPIKVAVQIRHAREMYCPASLARESAGEVDVPCKAEVCMAWRWVTTDTTPIRRNWPEFWGCDVEPERPASVPKSYCWVPYDPLDGQLDKHGISIVTGDFAGAHWAEPDESADDRRTGYCGLAGPL